MATYKVTNSGNDTTGTGSAENPFKTLTKVSPMLMPGDELLIDGKVTQQFIPARSGTAAKPITVRGINGAEITRQMQLADRQHIHVENLKMTAIGNMWVYTNKASGNNWFKDVILDSGPYPGDKGPFVGMLLHGDRNRLINPTVGTWYGGDAIQIWGDYNLVEDGDWSKCRCGHGPLMIFGNYNVARGVKRPIPVTNPWGRAFEMLGKSSNGLRNLFGNFVVTDTNWDGVTPWQGHPADKDGQLIKVGGDGAIYRDIEVRRSHKPNYPYACIFQIGNFESSGHGVISLFKNMRFYDLLMEDNAQHAFAITHNAARPFDCSNNRIFNSVLRRNNMSFWLKEEGKWLDTLYIEDSLVADPIVRGAATMTVEQYQAMFATAKRNSSTKVPPKAPLTYVTADSVGDVITLKDAYPLSDGNTVVEGDAVVIGGRTVQVREWLDATRVRLMEVAKVRKGDAVMRQKYAASAPTQPPPVVVVPVPIEPEPPVVIEPPSVEPTPEPEPVVNKRIVVDIEGNIVSVWVDDKIIYTTVP